MPNLSLTVVCLPEGTPCDRLADTAAAYLQSTPLAVLNTARYFLRKGFLQRGRLLQAHGRTAAGGPVELLDLDVMRANAHRAYWQRWQLWSQVVADTRPALPFWSFLELHRENPEGYPLQVAQQRYLAQPRIAAMRIYNALPGRVADLPTSHLEAFQVNAMSYANFGALQAVPCNSFVGMDGSYQRPGTEQYADHLTYLDRANRYIASLSRGDNLVAVYTRLWRPILNAATGLAIADERATAAATAA